MEVERARRDTSDKFLQLGFTEEYQACQQRLGLTTRGAENAGSQQEVPSFSQNLFMMALVTS